MDIGDTLFSVKMEIEDTDIFSEDGRILIFVPVDFGWFVDPYECFILRVMRLSN